MSTRKSIAIPVSQLADLVGMPPDSEASDLKSAAGSIAAEHQARAESDRRVIDTAIAEGRISKAARSNWLAQMRNHRASTIKLLAQLPTELGVPSAKYQRTQNRSAPANAAVAMPVTYGKAPENWSAQEVADYHLWSLGPLFRAGLKPPPARVVYWPPIEPYSLQQLR